MLSNAPDAGVLAHLFAEIANTLGGKGSLFVNDAQHLMKILIPIELVFLGIWLALDGGNAIRRCLTAVVRFGLFYWLVADWSSLIATIHDSFAQAGSKISNLPADNNSLITLTATILNKGTEACHGLLNTIIKMSFDSTHNSGIISLLVLCYALAMGGFFLAAVQILLVSVEFLVAAAIGIVLLPFGIFARTAFLAENVMRMVVVLGMRKMIMILLALILVGQCDAYTYPYPAVPSDYGAIPLAFDLMFWALAMGLLIWRVPLHLSALMHKTPSLYPLQSDMTNAGQTTPTTAGSTMGVHSSIDTGHSHGMEATRAAAEAIPTSHTAADIPSDAVPAERAAQIQQRMSARLKK